MLANGKPLAKGSKQLTTSLIDDLACEDGSKDQLLFDTDQQGLAVRVTSNGKKSYLVQYTINGQRRRVPLGSTEAVKLVDARNAAASIMGAKANDIDSASVRKAKAAAARQKREEDRLTLAVLVDEWRGENTSLWKPRYAVEATRALKVVFADHWNEPASALTAEVAARALKKLRKAGKVSMANRAAAYGRAAFNWHNAEADRQPKLQNPFPRTSKKDRAVEAPRTRTLSDSEVAEVWRAAEQMGAPYSQLVRFLILTGARREEAAGMAWSEISGAGTVWTVPGERTKNGEEHILPLPEAAQTLIKSQPKRKDERTGAKGKYLPVFAGEVHTFSGWSKCKTALDAKILAMRREAALEARQEQEEVEAMPAWVLHDLRRTVATGLQRLGVRLEVTERVLNHKGESRTGIVAVYQKHDWADEKAAALKAWAAHVEAIVSGVRAVSNVTVIHQQSGR